MNESESQLLTAKLAAAFPRDWMGEASFEVYAEQLARLANVEAAVATIDKVISSGYRLPTVAEIRDVYRRELHYHEQPALPEPELTEEERRENARLARELTDRIGSREATGA